MWEKKVILKTINDDLTSATQKSHPVCVSSGMMATKKVENAVDTHATASRHRGV